MSSSAGTLHLVTGATGMLGRRLLRALAGALPDVPRDARERPPRIRALLHAGAPDEELERLRVAGAASGADRIEWVRGDVGDRESLAPFFRDAAKAKLYHCAGIIHPGRVGGGAWDRVNRLGTANVVDAATFAGVARLVYVSSTAAAGTNPGVRHVFDEESLPCPMGGYGRSKRAGELAVLEARARGRLDALVLRAPWFYGPEGPARQTTMLHMLREGRFPLVGEGRNRRSMVYVDSLVSALLLAGRVESPPRPLYWIADARPYEMREVVETTRRLLHEEFDEPVHPRVPRLPGAAGRLAGLADGLLQACGLYSSRVHVLGELGETIACDIGRAQAELGYVPLVELEEGMRRTIAHTRARGGFA